jgi:hypothetical protein
MNSEDITWNCLMLNLEIHIVAVRLQKINAVGHPSVRLNTQTSRKR